MLPSTPSDCLCKDNLSRSQCIVCILLGVSPIFLLHWAFVFESRQSVYLPGPFVHLFPPRLEKTSSFVINTRRYNYQPWYFIYFRKRSINTPKKLTLFSCPFSKETFSLLRDCLTCDGKLGHEIETLDFFPELMRVNHYECVMYVPFVHWSPHQDCYMYISHMKFFVYREENVSLLSSF